MNPSPADTVPLRFAHLESGGCTHPGRVRAQNEDRLILLPHVGVFAVADGMGGCGGGAEASRFLGEQIEQSFAGGGRALSFGPRLVRLCAAVHEAGLRIRDFARDHDAPGAGATFVGLVCGDDPSTPAAIAHAGDSRAYRLRGREFERLTRDHAVATAIGYDDRREAPAHVRHLVLRAVGTHHDPELDTRTVDLVPGDQVLLCSDGLTEMLRDADIGRLLRSTAEMSARQAAAVLVDEANAAGGRDNISVVIIRMLGGGGRPR